MKLKVPKTVKILSIPHKVVWVENMIRDSDERGSYNLTKLEIELDPNLSDPLQTFIHEYVEGVNTLLELKLKHNIIESLSTAFAGFLYENLPQIIDGK